MWSLVSVILQWNSFLSWVINKVSFLECMIVLQAKLMQFVSLSTRVKSMKLKQRESHFFYTKIIQSDWVFIARLTLECRVSSGIGVINLKYKKKISWTFFFHIKVLQGRVCQIIAVICNSSAQFFFLVFFLREIFYGFAHL